MDRRDGSAARSRPWWSHTGSETCAVCLGTYDLEVEVRCYDCDSPLCPFCVVKVEATATLRCAECAPEEGRA